MVNPELEVLFDELVEESVLEQDRIDDELRTDESREIIELVEQEGHRDAVARKFGDTHLLLRTLAEEESELSDITEASFTEGEKLQGDVR